MNKEAGKKIIAERIEDFEKNKAVLTKKGHGETNIRSNYIDIMFNALGWNMKSHYEVVREYSQRDKSTDGGTKKVDYAFKINGKLKFFIEAKEASVDLEKDKAAIFQAKRYAYSSNGKAPIVILTDFEEFRVFNVIKAPLMDNTDRELLKSHTMKYTYYLEKWDLLWDTFSREAVENGSLDKLRGKIDKNTKTMDVDFLEQITSWRESLAKNIAIRNENLNVDEINEAVQRILDRLVFIRNLEDREIEPENTLLDKTKKAENIYKSIIPIFNSLNTTYNGLLFKKHFSEDIEVDDKTIKDIIRQMCYPVSPFQFDVIEPEILGRIYEKFLGSKIRLTDSHRAKIEEKIEVRKAGGVYYTPEYIVDYIVQNTVGKKIEGLTPEEIKKIKILDPACGSGSFLIGAYSYLLDYHHKWYTKNQKDKTYQADWYKTKDGEVKVSLDKRSDILRNNIFGVDIDKEATEVAIMSLYLKMLDDGFDKGERDLFFVKGSILPDMINNVKCGNSLTGIDYFDGKLTYDIEEMKKIRPFDWVKEFDDIFKMGGFHCVIGNPPWGADYNNDEKEYFRNKYKEFHVRTPESYNYFLAKICDLTYKNSYAGVIIPSSFLNQHEFNKTRKQIVENKNIYRICNLGDGVFEKVSAPSCIIIFTSNDIQNTSLFCDLRKVDRNLLPNALKNEDNGFITTNIGKDSDSYSLQVRNSGNIFSKCYKWPSLKDIAEDVATGISSGLDKAYVYTLDEINELNLENDLMKKLIIGGEICRYHLQPSSNKFIIYITAEDKSKDYKNIINVLSPYKDKLIKRREAANGKIPWYALNWPRRKKLFENPKILIRQTADKIMASFDDEKWFCLKSGIIIQLPENSNLHYYYILGLINSRLMDYLYNDLVGEQSRVFPEVKPVQLFKLPIRTINFSDSNDKNEHDLMISLVKEMLETQNKYFSVKSESDKILYKQKIEFLDNKIDDTVYRLYNLTDDEISIVGLN